MAEGKQKKEREFKSVLDLDRYLNQAVKVKFSGGREVRRREVQRSVPWSRARSFSRSFFCSFSCGCCFCCA